ncbi:MAG: nucleotidyltransferase domain-containing protein [Candidatus Aenigmatarchaeota archaeon]
MFLDKILGSKTKINLLYTLVSNPDREFSELELSKFSGVSVSETNRQIKDLIEVGLINMGKYGKTKIYTINKKHFLYKKLKDLFLDLLKIYRKIAKDIADFLSKNYAEVKSVILFGSVARKRIRKDFLENPSDIDILVICDNKKEEIKTSLIRFINSVILPKYGIVSYPIVVTEKEYFDGLKSEKLFINIHAEGEVIYGKKPKRIG